MSLNDLATDCIAELFRRDDRGQFLELKAYFGSFLMDDLTDEELLPHLRRLVFSKTNQGVYRLFSEIDPSLAKILRNVRLAVAGLKTFTEVERFGDPCIHPSLCETLMHLPPFDRDDLARELQGVMTGRELIPTILAKLAVILRTRNDRCRIIPILTVAKLIRQAYDEKRALPEHDIPVEPDPTIDETVTIVRQACEEIRRSVGNKYVRKGKLEEGVMRYYLWTIEVEILGRVNGTDGADDSLYTHLRTHLTDLSKEEYHRDHRSKLEYFLKLVSERVGHALGGNPSRPR